MGNWDSLCTLHKDVLSVTCAGTLFTFPIKLIEIPFVCLLANPLELVRKHSSRDQHHSDCWPTAGVRICRLFIKKYNGAVVLIVPRFTGTVLFGSLCAVCQDRPIGQSSLV